MIIECDGILYRGPNATEPTEVWNYASKKWTMYRGTPLPRDAAQEIDDARAELLKYDSPDAAHFTYYDIPPWHQPLGEGYARAICPPDLWRKIEERKAEWSRIRDERRGRGVAGIKD